MPWMLILGKSCSVSEEHLGAQPVTKAILPTAVQR